MSRVLTENHRAALQKRIDLRVKQIEIAGQTITDFDVQHALTILVCECIHCQSDRLIATGSREAYSLFQ